MQKAQARFASKGLRIASISYDEPAALKAFAKRAGITYPMLADPGSRLIREFRMVDPDNTENNVPGYGARDVAYPGYFVVDRSATIVERFVDARYDDRRTGNDVVAMLFPELLEARGRRIETPHLQVTLGQTDSRVTLGAHIRLLVDITLPRGRRVLAAGAEGYQPIALTLDQSPWYAAREAELPAAKRVSLKAIHATVPVLETRARITADIVVANTFALLRTLASAAEHRQSITVAGHLTYQACDEKACFPPDKIPVSWDLDVGLPDQTRISSGPPSEDTAALVLAAVKDARWRDIPTPAGTVRAWVSGEDDARRPAVIVVHPDAGPTAWARAAASALSTEGFRVFAPDVHGLDRPAVLTRLDGVLDAAGGSSAHIAIVGFSRGASDAFAYAVKQPQLAGVVMFDGPAPAPDRGTITVPVLELRGAVDSPSWDRMIEFLRTATAPRRR